MAEFKETAWNHIAGDTIGTFCTAEPRWIKRCAVWAEQYPEQVKIRVRNKDGSIVVDMPVKWFKLTPPRQVSDDTRKAASERMKKLRAGQIAAND